jgi:chromate reductase
MSEKQPVKLVAFAGSARRESLNRKLLALAVKAAEEAGAEVTVVDLGVLDLPIYNQDMEAEAGFPQAVLDLKKTLRDSDGFLIASPEHNSSYSALLKNMIDWTSRSSGAEDPGLACYTGKYAALMAASTGALGGLRGLFALRELLQNINVTVLPGMQAVGGAHQLFDDNGDLKDEKTAGNIKNLAVSLVGFLQKLRA